MTTQTPTAMSEPRSQTWPLAAAQERTSVSWPGWQAGHEFFPYCLNKCLDFLRDKREKLLCFSLICSRWSFHEMCIQNTID